MAKRKFLDYSLDMQKTESYGRPALPAYLVNDRGNEDDYSENSFDSGLRLDSRRDMEEIEGSHFIHRFQYEGD